MNLFLLDAYALIFRAYYALIKMPRMTSSGFNTSAIFGFVGTLEELLRKEHPTHMAVCFDPAGPTFRSEAYKDYKGERAPTPEAIKESIPIIKDILDAYGIKVLEVPGFEADDVIGTMAGRASAAGFITYMMTPDKDFGQLVTDTIFQYKPAWRGTDFEMRGPDQICDRYGIRSPRQVIDILALAGDKIDNIPGCPGIGEKTAQELIQQFGSVDELITRTDELKGARRKKIEDYAEQIIFSKYLATIRTDVPVEAEPQDLLIGKTDARRLFEIFDRLEFRVLKKRVAERLEQSAAETAPRQLSLFDTANSASGGGVGTHLGASSPASNVPPIQLSEGPTVVVTENASGVLEAAHRAGRCAIITIPEFWDDDISGSPRAWGVAIPDGTVFLFTDRHKERQKEAALAIRDLYQDPAVLCITSALKRDYVCLSLVLEPHDDLLTGSTATHVTPRNVYDVTLAHYLLDPDMRHTLEVVASSMLHVTIPDFEELFKQEKKSGTPLDLAQYIPVHARAILALYDPLCRALVADGLDGILRDIELPLAVVLGDMERAGVGLDINALNEGAKTMEKALKALEREIQEMAGTPFKVSSPAAVGEVLFEILQLDPKAKRTKSGNYSTAETVLEPLMAHHPIVAKIIEYRHMKKLLNTYLLNLPEYVIPDTGRIHTTYNQTITATGRISSSNPNLQNIPVRTEMGREIRRAFIPTPGNLFLSADYSQIELRLAADFSSDPTLLQAFRDGKDIHTITAAKIFHKDEADVTPDERRRAKTANFGILYGISPFGLSTRLGIPRAEGKELIDGYFASFPAIRALIDQSIDEASASGQAVTRIGRRRRLPEINSKNPTVRSAAERNAINAPIQGTAADIIKIAMTAIHRELHERGLKTRMVLQVHDELCFDVPPAELETVRALVVRHMEGAYTGQIPMEVNTGVGPNWLEAH